MLYPSFIEIVDTLSPLVTLGFGIYCAVNDTKPKDGKLSRPGKIALWGLIISGSITLLVKGNNLRVQLQQQEAKIRDQEKQRIEKAYSDSVNAAFEKATGDTLSKSVKELNNIKSASQSTLSSLNLLADKQQAALENTMRGLNPLFPLRVSLVFDIDMKEFYKKYPSTDYKNGISLYLDTLVYYATKAKIPNLISVHNHTGKPLDTINIPKVGIVDPFLNHTYFSVPENVKRQFDYYKHVIADIFLMREFNINLRKENASNSQVTLNFNLRDLFDKVLKNEASDSENKRIVIDVDMDAQIIHAEMLADNPEIVSVGSTDDFISLYDLQNSIIGIHIDNGLTSNPAMFKLKQLSIFTGYDFSRETSFDFTNKNINDICCNEVYARKIKPEEIR
jgi:hypothetical protein